MPESSPSAVAPAPAALARAFRRAFAANVDPVSGGSSTSGGTGPSSCGASSSPSSRSLCELRLPSTSRTAHRSRLVFAQAFDSRRRETEQVVERSAREADSLVGRLDLDELVVAG